MLFLRVLGCRSLIIFFRKNDLASKNIVILSFYPITWLLQVSVIYRFVAFSIPVLRVLWNRAVLLLFFGHLLIWPWWVNLRWLRLEWVLDHFFVTLGVILSNYSLLVVLLEILIWFMNRVGPLSVIQTQQLLLHYLAIWVRDWTVISVLYFFYIRHVITSKLIAVWPVRPVKQQS